MSILAPTEEVLKSVAGNAVNGMEMMRLLFEHRRQEIDITREVVTAAARNAENGEDMMELLIEIQRDITSNPHKVAKVATDGSDSGKELTILLNSETDAQFLENWITTKAELRGVEVDSCEQLSTTSISSMLGLNVPKSTNKTHRPFSIRWSLRSKV